MHRRLVWNIFRHKNFTDWNKFYTFVANFKKIMVTPQILTSTLFDEFKPPFKSEDFQKEFLTPAIQRGLFIAHCNALRKALSLKDECKDITLDRIMHDCTHHYLEVELSPLGFEFSKDSVGNSRDFFTRGDFSFILKKKDSSTNSTAVSKAISDQTAPKHIITISYMTDAFRSEITRIFVQYIQGTHIEYSYTITPEDIWKLDTTTVEIESHEVKHKKPKLKIKKNDAI